MDHEKTTPILLLLAFSTSLVFSQKRVDSRLLSTTLAQETKLLESYTSFKVAEIDLAQFKRDVSSLKETGMLWDIDDSLKLDMALFPHDVRARSFEASIVTESGEQKVDLPGILTYKGL
ncbi:MAG: hypothetical protein CR994_01635 [Maribacter sp.]|nr:MAG: hypothetical protein CR994_01635 [Maribacter sp.]